MSATDIAITVVVVLGIGFVTALLATRLPRGLRPWLGLALFEYLLCGGIQFYFSAEGDANGYFRIGQVLSQLLSISFSTTYGELNSLLIQQPSNLDGLVVGAGSNTGSMAAISGWLLFFIYDSPYAIQALMAGLSMFGALAIYQALRDAYPEGSALRLFVATVLFPSIAFWTAALHKESFGLIGIGLLMTGWRAAYRRQIRAIIYAPLGFAIIALFRAPALPPLLLGFVLYFVVGRLAKMPSSQAAILAPKYLAIGGAAAAVGMVLVSRAAPSLGVDQIGESMATQQQAWNLAQGGSSFDADVPIANSAIGQLASAPLGLLNALFRPQLFDVRNPQMLISAIEMTIITWMMFRAVKVNGMQGILQRVRRSPFLAMCAGITVIGCMFVGLATRNFGSLARYRVPFLPFYGAFLAVLTEGTVRKPVSQRTSPRTRQAPRTVPVRGGAFFRG